MLFSEGSTHFLLDKIIYLLLLFFLAEIVMCYVGLFFLLGQKAANSLSSLFVWEKNKCFIFGVMPPPVELFNCRSRIGARFLCLLVPLVGHSCLGPTHTLYGGDSDGQKEHSQGWWEVLWKHLNLLLDGFIEIMFEYWLHPMIFWKFTSKRTRKACCEWRPGRGEAGNPSRFFSQKSSLPWNRSWIKMFGCQSTFLLRMRWTES